MDNRGQIYFYVLLYVAQGLWLRMNGLYFEHHNFFYSLHHSIREENAG